MLEKKYVSSLEPLDFHYFQWFVENRFFLYKLKRKKNLKISVINKLFNSISDPTTLTISFDLFQISYKLQGKEYETFQCELRFQFPKFVCFR